MNLHFFLFSFYFLFLSDKINNSIVNNHLSKGNYLWEKDKIQNIDGIMYQVLKKNTYGNKEVRYFNNDKLSFHKDAAIINNKFTVKQPYWFEGRPYSSLEEVQHIFKIKNKLSNFNN